MIIEFSDALHCLVSFKFTLINLLIVFRRESPIAEADAVRHTVPDAQPFGTRLVT